MVFRFATQPFFFLKKTKKKTATREIQRGRFHQRARATWDKELFFLALYIKTAFLTQSQSPGSGGWMGGGGYVTFLKTCSFSRWIHRSACADFVRAPWVLVCLKAATCFIPAVLLEFHFFLHIIKTENIKHRAPFSAVQIKQGVYTWMSFDLKGCLRGYYTPNLKLACFVCYLKIINTFFLKNNVCILKQIVQGTQKWHWNFSRPSGF